jgi:RNA polymerase sigma-70 factor (ECF subfamily)
LTDSYEHLDDIGLVRAIRSGRTDACGQLVDRHLQSVYAVVFRIVGREADAEDLVQETFLRAFEKLELYDENYSLRNWLLKIATNLTLSHLRSRRRQKKLQQELAYSGAKWQNDSTETQDWEQCREFLDQLDENQRTAIVLFHFQQLPYAEVARAMNVPVNTVRTLIHRGRQRLRELMTRRIPTLENEI